MALNILTDPSHCVCIVVEREARRKQALALASQPTQPTQPQQQPPAKPAFASGFGFGAPSSTASSSPSTSFGASSSSSTSTNATASTSTPQGRERRKPWTQTKGIAPKVKAWPDADPNRPRFTDDWEVEYFDTLQWTDVKTNHNKYYCLELHIGKDKGKQVVRLYTHYGRTDDLVKNPKAGKRENRFYSTLEQAEDAYAALIEEKTLTKGYRKVELVFSNIGSDKLRTLVSEIASQKAAASSSSKSKSSSPADTFVDLTPLTSELTDLVRYIYDEASAALNNTLGPAKITSLGIETPLGVVNLAQIDKGEAILQRLYEMFKLGTHDEDAISDLTNQFYTMIPHNLGRQRAQISSTRINSMAAFEEKQELLQLMRDMLHVTAEGKTLGASDIDMKYRALRAKMETIHSGSDAFDEVKRLVMRSHPHGLDSNDNANADLIDIKHVYAINRPAERSSFNSCRIQANQQILFHGSRISNYVGLLSRGLMMPKMVVAMGGKRRDGGLLGNGIYFGDSADTSAQYCTPGSKGTRLMLINNVALGTVKDYEQVVFGLMEPPQGFHSVHGVRNTPGHRTDFKDDEYVIFNPAQQYQQYLVEFTLKQDLNEFVTSQVFHAEDGTSSMMMKDGSKSPAPPSASSSSAASPVPEVKDSISTTVDDIFANLGSLTTTSSSSTASSKLGGSFISKYSAAASSSTFTTPFSSMLSTPSGAASDALRLQPSSFQVGGMLKPSNLQLSSSVNAGNLRLQPSGLDTTSSLLSGSLKLQPSGLTTSVKVAPLGSSFGRKSAGQTDPYAAPPPNVLQLGPIDASGPQSSTASGAAVLLMQKPAADVSELTEEEKAAKRVAMKMGGKNFGSRFAASTSEQDSVVSAAPTNVASSYAYSADVDAYTFDPNTTKTATELSAPTSASASSSTAVHNDGQLLKKSKKRTIDDISPDLEVPHKKPKFGLGDTPSAKKGASIMFPDTTSSSSSARKPSPLSATSIGFGSSAPTSAKPASSSSWTSSFKATLSSTPLSASAKPSSYSLLLGSASLGASIGLSSSATRQSSSVLGSSASSVTSLSASATSFPVIRTTFTRNTTQSKLSALLPKELLKERLTESKIRALYTTDRTNVLLKDHVLLVDVFKKREHMRNTIESDMEQSMPKILTRHRMRGPVFDASAKHPFGVQYDPDTQGEYCIVEPEQFKANFASLTNNIFSGLDTKNLLFVGDLVLGALLRNPEGSYAGSDVNIANLYRDADVEIAIYGLEGEAANKKISEILFALQSATKSSAEILRTHDEIIILGQFPIRNIRIPIRFFKGPAEAIFSRDVDCSCVGFDGSSVWALPRAQRAITKRYNLADLELQHVGYEVNLYKWAKRGFAVAVPGFQHHLVTPHLFQQKPWQVTGLAKLLLFEEEMNAKYTPPTAPGQILPCEPWMPKYQRFPVYSRDEFSMMRIHEFQAKQKKTYPNEKEDIDALEVDHHSNLFVPWGPQWRVSRVKKHLQYANSQFFQSTNKQLLTFGIDGITNGSPSSFTVVAEDLLDIDASFGESSTKKPSSPGDVEGLSLEVVNSVSVPSGPLNWIPSSSPSSSTVGVSDVVDDNDWYREAYCVEGSAVELTHALTDLAFSGESGQLSKLLRKLPRGSDVSHVSSFPRGRCALAYASLNGDSESISQLIAKGASPTAVDAASGLSPIHWASFSGDASSVETLLRQTSVDINVKSRDQRWTPLHFACYYGNVAVLQVLLHDTKIRLNPRDKGGRTPVFVAAYAGHLKCLEMLKSAGAKMDTKAPKEEIGVTALQVAAQNGHADVRTYLVDLLKPDFPPMLQPSAEALAGISLVEGVPSPAQASSLLRQSQEMAMSASRIANPKDVADWSRLDRFGQNMLHYAVKHAELALVRQIVQKALAQRDPRYPGLEDICMPRELSSYNLVDIHAENQYGQNALYYAQHMLDAFVGGKQLEQGDVAGTIEALGMPNSPKSAALRSIVSLLKRCGLSPAHLCIHRALPEYDDEVLLNSMKKYAREAKLIIKNVESARQQRELELRAEELASRPMARTPIKRRTSNDTPGTASLGRHSPHASPSLHRSGRGSNSTTNQGRVRQTGPGFQFTPSPSSSSIPTSITEFANANDTTQLLVTISQMHKAKQLTDSARHVLKTLALRKERTLFAALKAFQQDHVSLVFGNTLQLIAKVNANQAR